MVNYSKLSILSEDSDSMLLLNQSSFGTTDNEIFPIDKSELSLVVENKTFSGVDEPCRGILLQWGLLSEPPHMLIWQSSG